MDMARYVLHTDLGLQLFSFNIRRLISRTRLASCLPTPRFVLGSLKVSVPLLGFRAALHRCDSTRAITELKAKVQMADRSSSDRY